MLCCVVLCRVELCCVALRCVVWCCVVWCSVVLCVSVNVCIYIYIYIYIPFISHIHPIYFPYIPLIYPIYIPYISHVYPIYTPNISPIYPIYIGDIYIPFSSKEDTFGVEAVVIEEEQVWDSLSTNVFARTPHSCQSVNVYAHWISSWLQIKFELWVSTCQIRAIRTTMWTRCMHSSMNNFILRMRSGAVA